MGIIIIERQLLTSKFLTLFANTHKISFLSITLIYLYQNYIIYL